MNKVNASINIQVSIPTNHTNPQEAINELLGRIGDGLGIRGVKLELNMLDEKPLDVEVEHWDVEIDGVGEDWEEE